MEKLLIVDDNLDLRKVLRISLGYGKYQLLEAEDGSKALEIIRRETPEIIILDIMMPGINGFDVCRSIKSDPSSAGAFVIMLTALGEQENLQKAQEAGADFYITKPFSPSELIEVIEGVRTGRVRAEDIKRDGQAIDLRLSNKMIPADLKSAKPH